jgi:cellulose synthase/poly-beta-1,6-N-acetylglucosamine synthase-like glycosyltransferase
MLSTALLFGGESLLLILWLRLGGLWLLGLMYLRASQVPPASYVGPARVSVLIPAFQEEALIGETLKALQLSTFAPWEVIVVDDGSTDCTASVANQALRTFPRGFVLCHDKNRGKAAAINSGLAVCRGDLILILDADTRLLPASLSIAMAEQERVNADAVAFWIEVEQTHGLLVRLQHQEYLAAFNLERSGQSALGIMAILPGSVTLLRRSMFEVNQFSSRTYTEDADFTLTLSRAGARFTLAPGARARTIVPCSWRAIIDQRTRWQSGHLQCVCLHLPTIGEGSLRHRLLTLPNFMVSTLVFCLGLLVIVCFARDGRSPLLHLDLSKVILLTTALVYLQRISSWRLCRDRSLLFWEVLLEPLVSSIWGGIAFLMALRRLALVHRRLPWQGTWSPPR